MVSQLASKFAFFPPSPPTYQLKNRDDGKLTVVSTASPIPHPDDNSLDVLLVDTKHGNKIVAFYLKNPYARLTLLYSHGNAADLGQLYDLFVQLKVNLRVNLMGLVFFFLIFCSSNMATKKKHEFVLACSSSVFFFTRVIVLCVLMFLSFLSLHIFFTLFKASHVNH